MYGSTNLPTALDRFWGKVEKTETCWLWTGALDEKGYGHSYADGRYWLAHRYALAQSSNIEGLEVDHMCRNPSCVRPDHLQAVSRVANCENLKGAHRDSSTGVRGVSWDAERAKFVAQVGHLGRKHWGGRYETLEEASEAVLQLRLRLHSNNLLDRASV